MKIGYIMSRFPKFTETFIIREMLEVRRQGVPISIYPLIRQNDEVTHREVQELMPDVRFTPFLSLRVVMTNVRYLLRHPIRYLSVLWMLLMGMSGSLGMALKTLVLFPKSVRIGHRMKRDGITHVHAHFATFPVSAALVIKRLTGISFSFTAHGSDIHVPEHRHGLDRKIAISEFAVMVSQYNRRFVEDQCEGVPADKLVVLRCGIRPEEYECDGMPSSSPDRPFTVVCVASFNPVKGHQYLIEACNQLQGRGREFVCQLVGDGPLRDRIERQIEESGLGERMILRGMLSQDEVKATLRKSDVFVLPSVLTSRGDREGLPVALMEAMATGLPVVTSDISGIPELVDDESTGLLVPCRDPESIAGALARLEDDAQLRRRLGENAREKVREECNLKDNVSRLIDLWTQT